MKIDLPKALEPADEDITSYSGGITSPYSDDPLAPVFILGMRGGANITLREAEAVALHAALTVWIDEMPRRKQSLALARGENV